MGVVVDKILGDVLYHSHTTELDTRYLKLTYTPTAAVKPSTDSTTAFQFQNASGVPIFNVDTINKRIGVNIASPQAPLHLSGRFYQVGLGCSTFLGYEAGLNDDLNNRYNTAIGYQALRSNVSGIQNIAIGYQSLYKNTASNNFAFGFKALYENTSGSDNFAIGIYALTLNTTGRGIL
jgi:hypothetical protein